jgi:hypothetical protein
VIRCSAWGDGAGQFSTGFPAFRQPSIPASITKTFVYPSFAASRAALWLACHLGFLQ